MTDYEIIKGLFDNHVFPQKFDPFTTVGALLEDIGGSSYNTGANKGCFILNNFPYVIKYTRSSSDRRGFYDETKREVELYEEAKKKGIECFFPETLALGTYGKYFFSLQAKIDDSADGLDYSCECHYKNITCKTVSRRIIEIAQRDLAKTLNRRIDRVWISMVISLYGKKKCREFCSFVNDNRINDLHTGNIGYLNNKPIVLDFCGFKGC